MTLKITFTADEVAELFYWKERHPHPRVRKKMSVLYLKSQQLTHKEIKRLERITEATLLAYLKAYQQPNGLEALKEIRFNKPKSDLMVHKDKIEAYFREYPPATSKAAAAKIEELTGIKRSDDRVRIFMKQIGMDIRKVGMIPAKVDVEAQEKFLENELKPRIQEAQEGKRALFFVDAAHFVLAPFLGFLWSFTRVFIKAPCGRQRYNVLGALNAITLQLITITNDSYINANSVCELLEKIAALALKIPITLVLDNAKYQRCEAVFACAKRLNIELLFLPTYSPNLNLIERLWKFVKKKCLYSKYYDKFPAFKSAINNCLDKLDTDHKKELTPLMTLNFQTFKNIQVLAR